jgi:hypothetical protein
MVIGDILIQDHNFYVITFVNDASIVLRRDYKFGSLLTMEEAVKCAAELGNEHPVIYTLTHNQLEDL